MKLCFCYDKRERSGEEKYLVALKMVLGQIDGELMHFYIMVSKPYHLD